MKTHPIPSQPIPSQFNPKLRLLELRLQDFDCVGAKACAGDFNRMPGIWHKQVNLPLKSRAPTPPQTASPKRTARQKAE